MTIPFMPVHSLSRYTMRFTPSSRLSAFWRYNTGRKAINPARNVIKRYSLREQ
ncbi:hypothetical protein G6D77_000614 [Salmonella enterica]|nr:hypothetical protein [Salmonella enterica]